jgi:hypothetical protein
MICKCESESAAEDVDDANETGCIPFDSHSAIDLIVPEAGAGNVESAVGFLHDDTVGDELEVFVDGRDALEDLGYVLSTSSQIWLVHSWASLTL